MARSELAAVSLDEPEGRRFVPPLSVSHNPHKIDDVTRRHDHTTSKNFRSVAQEQVQLLWWGSDLCRQAECRIVGRNGHPASQAIGIPDRSAWTTSSSFREVTSVPTKAMMPQGHGSK